MIVVGNFVAVFVTSIKRHRTRNSTGNEATLTKQKIVKYANRA